MTESVEFEVQDLVCDGHRTLVLVGELDLASAPVLEQKIRRLCANGTREIALDFSKLSFIDSTGVRAVLIANELCNRRGSALSLVPGSAGVQRTFELTGLLEALPFRAGRPKRRPPA